MTRRDRACSIASASFRSTISRAAKSSCSPKRAAAFLDAIAARLRPGEFFLLGADLVKRAAVLEAAYDDRAGITAEFNRNVLRVINRELGADFNPSAFEHVAFFDPRKR